MHDFNKLDKIWARRAKRKNIVKFYLVQIIWAHQIKMCTCFGMWSQILIIYLYSHTLCMYFTYTIFMTHSFRLPNDDRRQKWIDAIGAHQQMSYPIPGYFWICSNHFDENHITKKNGKSTLSHGAIPTRFDAAQRVTHEIGPIATAPHTNEHLRYKLQSSCKIQSLEKNNAKLQEKIRLLKMRSVELEKECKSQQKTISVLETKINEVEMMGPLHGIVRMSVFYYLSCMFQLFGFFFSSNCRKMIWVKLFIASVVA